MRARIFGFNRMAAEMKGTPKSFTKKESNEWRLEPSKNSNATPDVKKIEKQALVYLNRVIDQHPGTPWAELASKEKDTPLGWEWWKRRGITTSRTRTKRPNRSAYGWRRRRKSGRR